MQFYDVIENRTSVKRFKNISVDREKMNKIINAAMLSPSWKNESSYKFILVEDKQKKSIIADSINNKTEDAAQSIREAPMVAVVVADPNQSGVVENKEYYLVDAAIAMEHFILAATAEGYGTCWIAAVDEKKVKDVLQIPNEYKVIGLTPVGETSDKKEHYTKKNVNDYVFCDTWNKAYSEKELVMH